MNIAELAKFRGGVSVDTITELTSASGVTVDGMLIKDGKISSDNIQNDGTADSPRGYAISTNADLAMTIANTRVYVTATSANRTVTLPTTSVKAGMVVEVATACTSPYTIAINSSGANLIDTLKGTKGKISLMALQDAPTAAAHWRVMDVYDEGTWVPILVFTGGLGTISSSISGAQFVRTGTKVFIKFYCSIVAIGTASGDMGVSGFPFPSEPTAQGYQCFSTYFGSSWTDSIDPACYMAANSSQASFTRNGLSSIGAANVIGANADFMVSGEYIIKT